jgi:adenosylcobyric acid synthase
MTAGTFTLAVIAYPQAIDLDEFAPLERVPGVSLLRATTRDDVQDADCIVLPGSAGVAADLRWLRRQGLDSAVAQHAQARRPVLGLGGGLQMLGEALIDPQAIEGNGPGLGLLALVSLLEAGQPPTPAQLTLGSVIGPWAPLSGMTLTAFAVHQGRSVQHAGMGAARAVGGGLAWQNDEGNVLGLSLRGLFENACAVQALFGPF